MTKQELIAVPSNHLWSEWGELDGLTAYNIWLKDYLLNGGEIHEHRDTKFPADKVIPVDDPNAQAPNNSKSFWSGNYIYILNPKFDVYRYDYKFVSPYTRSTLYGWTDNGSMPVRYRMSVSAYTDTIDKDTLGNP